ncbi:uncharacterized protein EURHEDRAFT_417418 [Aspergillus ruber CBS 135680]|uniref:Uncharacterized protein n=1 Tax=Aspergillus ruber (strain CBS 135680) TaxID=1388766 RepID=A0A017S2Q4_ASPRC|nr:uncharacterized protein EURHEDRAFT_417418 [Aspergillus ruber CBS 135680]EYE90450.1 hypothetical protein EURHEDRAFT_417418 [Aspergillus ruber CBS 135680]
MAARKRSWSVQSPNRNEPESANFFLGESLVLAWPDVLPLLYESDIITCLCLLYLFFAHTLSKRCTVHRECHCIV